MQHRRSKANVGSRVFSLILNCVGCDVVGRGTAQYHCCRNVDKAKLQQYSRTKNRNSATAVRSAGFYRESTDNLDFGKVWMLCHRGQTLRGPGRMRLESNVGSSRGTRI